MSFAGLPDLPAIKRLQERAQWVAWKYEYRNGPDKKPTKPPVSPRTGFGASHSNPNTWGTYSQAVEMAVRRNLAGVGFALSPDDQICGIDLDGCRDPETGKLDDWAHDIILMGETYAEVSPSGTGIRLFALGKPERVIKSDKAHVEIYGELRYLTVTGQHVEGTPIEIREAPDTIAALLARVEVTKREASEASAPVSMIPSSHGGDFFSRVNDLALANLGAWVSAIFGADARFYPSTGAYRVTSRRLGRDLEEDLSIAPNGIVDFGVADMGDRRDGKRTAIDLCLEYGKGKDASDAALWLCGQLRIDPAELGWGDFFEGLGSVEHGRGVAMKIKAPRKSVHGVPVRHLTRIEGGAIIDQDGVVVEDGEDETSEIGGASDQWDLPDADMACPGVIGDLTNWICDTTSEPIRIHALGAALTIVGTILARKVYSLSKPTGTHIYVGAIAPSGWGKQHPQDCIKLALDEASGTPGQLYMPWAQSMPKIGVTLCEKGAKAMIIDEFADKLSSVRNRNASVSTTAISEGLRTLWGINFGNWSPDGALIRSDSLAIRPSLGIYGASTIKDFSRSLVSKDVTNGLFNRFLIMPRFGEIDMLPEVDGVLELPPSIRDDLQAMFRCLPGDQSALSMRGDTAPGSPVLVPFSDDADRMNTENKAFQKEMMKRSDEDDALALYGRYAEMIKRIALIVACGRSPRDLKRAWIDAADMEFARKIVTYGIEQFVLSVRRDMVEGWVQEQHNMVLGIIRKAGKKGIARSALYRRVKGRIRSRELNEILVSLREGANINVIPGDTTTKGGRPPESYRFLRD